MFLVGLRYGLFLRLNAKNIYFIYLLFSLFCQSKKTAETDTLVTKENAAVRNKNKTKQTIQHICSPYK